MVRDYEEFEKDLAYLSDLVAIVDNMDVDDMSDYVYTIELEKRIKETWDMLNREGMSNDEINNELYERAGGPITWN